MPAAIGPAREPNRRWHAILALTGLVCPLAAAAAETFATAGYFEDLPIVLTPSRLPQPLREAPAAVTVIDRDLIAATGYRDIARLLRLVPGMQVGQERGNRHWVTYHGLSSDYPSEMQVLIDGRAVYSPATFAGVDWQALPVTLDEIERIEVVRGSDAVAFGPNAFLGVVNIITRPMIGGSQRQATLNLGNAGIADLSAAIDGEADGQTFRLTAASRQDSGFQGLFDGSRVHTLGLRTDLRLGNHDELSLRLAGSRSSPENGYADSLFRSNGDRRWQGGTVAWHSQWRHVPASGEELLLSYAHSENDRQDEWTGIGPRPDLGFTRPAVAFLNRNTLAVRNSLELQHRYSPAPGRHLLWGGELRQESSRTPYVFSGRNTLASRLLRLFGNLETELRPDLTINVGGMAEKYSDDRLRLSPRLFANWRTTAETTLRGGYSRSWRDRNYFERYSDVRVVDAVDGQLLLRPYLPNPDIRPSRIDSLELGYLARLTPGNTTLDLRLFDERVTDLVIAQIQPPAADAPVLSNYLPSVRSENLGSPVRLRGAEYQLHSRPRPGTRLLFSHSMIRRSSADPAVAALAAPYTASLTWLQEWPAGWSTTATLFRMGPLANSGGPLPLLQRAAAYTTGDLRIAHRRNWGSQAAELALVAINLGGRHQEIVDSAQQLLHPGEPVNPVSRMVFLSLTLSDRR